MQALAVIAIGAGAGFAYGASRDDGAVSGPTGPAPVQASAQPTRTHARRKVDHRPDPAPRVAPKPPRIEIPSIKVKAHAISLGKTPDNRLEVPGNWSEVGWWSGGPLPGDRGPAVVVGHVDSKAGPAVFYKLRELRSGAVVKFVRPDHTTARFVVERSESYSKSNFPTAAVYGPTRDRELRLVTCGGSFDWSTGHYRDNLVVFARAA